MPPMLLLAAAIETALNRLLAMDPEAPARLAGLRGATVAFEVHGMNLLLYLVPVPHGFQVMHSYHGVPEVLVRGSPAAFLLLARGATAQEAGVEIVGDPLAGQALQKLLRELDIDWEEQASKVFGDVLAHRFGRFARGALGWLTQARETLFYDGAQFIQQEAGALPVADRVHELLDAIDTLRADADRLDARLARLEARLASR